VKRDIEATTKRHFKNPNSFVFKDGREWLEGADWDDRRFELLQRCRGICEYLIQDDHRCLREAADPHHKILRSIARDDRLSNLMAVCRHHHRVLDLAQRRQHGKNKIHFSPEAA
jgi:hypothetical protein